MSLMKMAYLVKFAFILNLLRNGVQLEAVQLRYVATESLGGDDISNKLKETTKLPLIAPNTRALDKAQTLRGRESLQRQTFGINPGSSESHQFKRDVKGYLSCLPEEFACADGFCIPGSKRCDGHGDCGGDDRSDESESLCTPPCSVDMFACADGTECYPKQNLCNGYFGHSFGCADNSNNYLSNCDNCSADHLFKCQREGIEVCINIIYKCDGKMHCSNFADELVSECPYCEDDASEFTCRIGGQMVCWTKEYLCDGEHDCDDGSDEDPSVCDNCSQPDLALCRDGNTCFPSDRLCDGKIECSDGSDESDSYSQCEFCTEVGAVPCPGFPGNCGKLCDGAATCPDMWDELLSTCQYYLGNAAICNEEANLYKCKDGSMCLSNNQVCDGIKDCLDGSDEESGACKDKCPFRHHQANHHYCDNSSCIRFEMACTAQNRPLCEDGSDMDFSLCEGKCYTLFPYIEDPYRWPCTEGTTKCILYTSRCDGYSDCDDSSDELKCPLVTQIGLLDTLLICLAIMIVLWVVFFSLSPFSNEQYQSSEDSSLTTQNSDPAPFFLIHPALSDLDDQSWNWKEVGEQLKIEVVFFNRDPEVLFEFLYHMESQNAHPCNVHSAFEGFYDYLASKGYDLNAVAFNLRKTIGHHRLAHMALKGPPSFVDKKVFEIGEWLMELETKGKVYHFILNSVRAIQTSRHPFLLNLDYVKDIILYLILRETLKRMEENCVELGLECLAASGIENDIVTALLITLCVSITLTSIDSFSLRKNFFKSNLWLDLIFAVLSPVLPAIYHFRLNQMSFKLDEEKSQHVTNKAALIRKARKIENLSNSLQLSKEIEVGFEAIIQILLLLGLLCFYPYVGISYMFKAPSGQTYSYFFGVAHIVLKGNYILLFASITLSFLGPCRFYANRTNLLRHESLNLSRRFVLIIRNVLFLLVRVFAITSAIFITVIKSWDVFIKNQGIDASSALSFWGFHIEFQKYFSKGLDALTADIRINALFFGLFLIIHIILVAIYGIFRSANFGKGTKKEQAIYLISTFCLPLPFLSIRGIDRGQEKAELWFLVALHSLENFLIVLASRLVYTQSSYYPLGILAFDCVLVLVNIMAVLVSVLYVTKIELYAGLPRNLPSSLPSFGLEVSFGINKWT